MYRSIKNDRPFIDNFPGQMLIISNWYRDIDEWEKDKARKGETV